MVVNLNLSLTSEMGVLKAYATIGTILENQIPYTAVCDGKKVRLSDILIDEETPEEGFKKEFLPKGVKDVSEDYSTDLDGIEEVVSLTYENNIDIPRVKEHWESLQQETVPPEDVQSGS